MAPGTAHAAGPASVASLSTEGDNEKYSSFDGGNQDRISQHTAVDDAEAQNSRENDGLLGKNEDDDQQTHPQTPEAPPKKSGGMTTAIIWMVVNTLATIGIVFTNKAIFSDPSPETRATQLRGIPLLRHLPHAIHPVAATAGLLRAAQDHHPRDSSPLCRHGIERHSAKLVPGILQCHFLPSRTDHADPYGRADELCALQSHFASKRLVGSDTRDANVKTTSGLGVMFAFCGIFASSLYTVWIASYHRKLQMTSMQLLFNQAPVAAFLLLYSGAFASLINISQFFIIAKTGPVSSTVVGHLKTCTIVALGWATSGRGVGDKSVIGVLIAVGGIVAYSIVMLQHKAKGGGKA
ncbi:Solute carrier family 35 member E3 [Apiospora phragmitis]|uniref:GDP-mannose transporter n=1 Tax=Apiospora phragmitis TaxID=2905665 RepID=A0ABR1TTL6_9PEZI